MVRGAHLKKFRRAEGGANIFGVFAPPSTMGNKSYLCWLFTIIMYVCYIRLPETCWEVVSHSDWQIWRSCQTEKYFAGPKTPPKKFTVMCIMFSLAFLECFTLVLAIGHLISPLVFIEVKVIQFSVFSVVQNCISYVFYSVCLEFCCFDDLVL